MTLRSIEAIPLKSSTPGGGVQPGPAPQLLWLKIADLRIDPAYQRSITATGRVNVAKIAAAFQWSRFAPVVVAPIEGGLYAVVDGQHRATAAASIGLEMVPCQIILADRSTQAAAFSAINAQVTRMHGMTIHRAAVAAGDPDAVAVDRAARAAGVTILPYPKIEQDMAPGETMAIGAIRSALRLYGEDIVILALRAICSGPNLVKGGLGANIIRATVDLVAWLGSQAVDAESCLTFVATVSLQREVDLTRRERSAGQSIATALFKRLKSLWLGAADE